MLISEIILFKNYFKISSYLIYHIHPNSIAYGSTVIIIKTTVRYPELDNFESDILQATTVEVEDWSDSVVVSSVYCPLKHIMITNILRLSLKIFKTLSAGILA